MQTEEQKKQKENTQENTEAQPNLETLEEQTRIQLLTQGIYTCKTKPTLPKKNEPQYQNNLQLQNEISENAQKISAIIKTTPQYNVYFQPILEQEDIQLGKMTEDNIEECTKETPLPKKINQINVSKFISLKSRYYKHTWKEQMEEIKKTQPKKTLQVFIESVHHMIQMLKTLQSKNIIHFNVHEKNIVCSNTRILPVLSNYNLSFQQEELETETAPDNLFPDYTEYKPWPIEVYLASRIANIKEQTNWETKIITREQMKEWIHEFTESSIFVQIASEERRELLAIQFGTYFHPMINKTVKQLYENLIQTAKTWDVYGMCIHWLEKWLVDKH
jgi:hypothetical protein